MAKKIDVVVRYRKPDVVKTVRRSFTSDMVALIASAMSYPGTELKESDVNVFLESIDNRTSSTDANFHITLTVPNVSARTVDMEARIARIQHDAGLMLSEKAKVHVTVIPIAGKYMASA